MRTAELGFAAPFLLLRPQGRPWEPLREPRWKVQTYLRQFLKGPGYLARGAEGLEASAFTSLQLFPFGLAFPFSYLSQIRHSWLSCLTGDGSWWTESCGPSLAGPSSAGAPAASSSSLDAPRCCHFSHRVRLAGMKISRPPTSVGHYKMVKHRADKGNEENPHRWEARVARGRHWALSALRSSPENPKARRSLSRS